MTETHDRRALEAALSTYGADLARWPEADHARMARRAALADPAFRRAFDTEKALDAMLAEAREATDRAIGAEGAAARIRSTTLARIRRDPLADLSWRRLAAAMVLSAMVGSSVDLLFAAGTTAEDATVAVAALAWPEDAEAQ